MVFELLFKLHKRTHFGGKGSVLYGVFYPIPPSIRKLFNYYTLQRQLIVYSKLCKNTDLSFIAPNEVGCAESVTRLLREIDPDLTPVLTGTWTLLQHLTTSKRWVELTKHIPGCVVIAATGTGYGDIAGHVGIYDGDRIWNNNSNTGRWTNSYTIQTFTARYLLAGGMRVRFFAPLNKK
jgi:hypothetical protein